MATNIFTLPIGVPVVTRPSSAVMNVWVAPGAAGGVLIETSPDGVNYTAAPQGLSTSPYSLNTGTPGQNNTPLLGYIRMTASTTAGIGLVSDFAQVPGPTGYNRTDLVVSGVAYAKQNATTEQAWFSCRFPAGYLRPNFRIEWEAAATLTNGANVKTAKAYFGNSANTALEGGTAVWSNVYTSMAGARFGGFVVGRNDGASVYGSNPGLLSAGGWGSSTTANVVVATPNANYAVGAATVEQSLVLSVTTATTGTDLFTLDAIKVSLYQ